MKSATAGAVIVTVAVIWKGIGTAIVGHHVDPELSSFTTFAAFLTAAILSGIGYAVAAKRKSRRPAETGASAGLRAVTDD